MDQNNCLINFSDNPNKKMMNRFLEEFAQAIDNAIVKSSNIVLMGDINYFNNKERENLNSLWTPYDLEALIDYIIS